ncbi:hypothetical protein HKD37_18G050046 [Glycine soja]
MGFSVTIMALLARLRVLIQQILLDVVSLFNMVSSLAIKKQSIKITDNGTEVFRDFYPVSDDFVTLKCRKHRRVNENQAVSCGNVSVQTSNANYNCIVSFLGDDQFVPKRVEADVAAKEDPCHINDEYRFETTYNEEEENQGIMKASINKSLPMINFILVRRRWHLSQSRILH